MTISFRRGQDDSFQATPGISSLCHHIRSTTGDEDVSDNGQWLLAEWDRSRRRDHIVSCYIPLAARCTLPKAKGVVSFENQQKAKGGMMSVFRGGGRWETGG